MKLLSRRYFYFLILIYSAFIFYVTAVPFKIELSNWPLVWERVFNIWGDTNFYTSKGDIFANCLLFGLLGVLLKSAFLPHEKWHELKIVIAIIYGFLLCYFIEVFQIFFPARRSSLLDIWVDTLACAAGVLLAWLFQASNINRYVLRWTAKTFKENPYCLGSIGIAFICVLGALFPFNFDPHLSGIRERIIIGDHKTFFLKDWSSDLFWYKSLFTLVLYFLFSFVTYLAIIFRKQKGYKWGGFSSVFAAGGLIVSCEFFQLFFTPHYFETSQIGMGIMGGLIGAASAYLLEPFILVRDMGSIQTQKRFTLTFRLVFFLGLLTLTLIDWLKPFQFDLRYDVIREKINNLELIPFGHYTKHFSYWSVEDFFRKVVILSVWGSFFVYWMQDKVPQVKLRPILSGLVTAVLTGGLELFQIAVVGRVLSTTDVIVGFLSGCLGGVLVLLLFKLQAQSSDESQELRAERSCKLQTLSSKLN